MKQVIREEGSRPIKIWTDDIESGALQQAKNLARLPFIASNGVALMPDVHMGKGAAVGAVIATHKAVIPAAAGVDLGCFRGDTKVPLLDGSQATMLELSKRKDPFWVYSIDNDTLKIQPGLAICRKTRRNAKLMRIVVSGGEEIICTPDHKFMRNDGTYVEAQNLKFNDSLMPLYRRWETRDGYESVSNGKGNQKMTHKMVWEYFNGPLPRGFVVHHKNHVHFNNCPSNLVSMKATDHSSYHRAVGHSFDNSDPVFQEKRREGIAKRMEDPEKLTVMVDVGTRNITKYMQDRPEHFAKSVAGNGKRGAPYLEKFNTSPRACNDCGEEMNNPAALRWHKHREHGYNHKVNLVEHIDERADVYCLTVEKHHNFALSAGVFVHNCGMMAFETTLQATDLPDSLTALRDAIERSVPHGFENIPGRAKKGSWEVTPDSVVSRFRSLADRYDAIVAKHPKIAHKGPHLQMGTLGGGNHFIEVCLDERDTVWVMLHSGSRGVGNNIGRYFIDKAKEEMAKHFIHLPDKDLSYLVEGSTLFDDYCEAVDWAQDYAMENRKAMMTLVLGVMHKLLPSFSMGKYAVNAHHNYISRESHFGQNLLVTRKGAIRAREGDLGIIPGSMGQRSYIVKGKGNRESYCSCSHGAGRKMSRTEARRQFTVDDLKEQTEGVECRKDDSILDEIPGSYKDIDVVMANQADLVDVVHVLKAVLCVKGA